ncbi:MAG TPA: ComEC/Rec2 family competence protein [Blastocatellia bacterium]|nr:ComEC/Rec2 family competence protein [Blastocatellia bacterium]
MAGHGTAAAIACAFLVIGAMVTAIRPVHPPIDGKLTVSFLDVGQGDSALIVFPKGTTMLVDAGGEIHLTSRPAAGRRAPKRSKAGRGKRQRSTGSPEGPKGGTSRQSLAANAAGNIPQWQALDDTAAVIGEPVAESTYDSTAGSDDEANFDDSGFSIGEAVVSRFLWSRGMRNLNYLLATHAHQDHIGGMQDVLRNFTVGDLLVGHVATSSADFRHLERWAAAQHVPIESVTEGNQFYIDGVKVEVLWPALPAPGEVVTSVNNDSVVLRLTYGSVSFVLAGDAEQPAEDAMIASGAGLQAQVLKVGHHGSRTSSSEEFIDAVKPKYAIISVGERSRFGHPHKEVVDRYLAHGINLLETGRDGTITAVTDGTHLTIATYRTNYHGN